MECTNPCVFEKPFVQHGENFYNSQKYKHHAVPKIYLKKFDLHYYKTTKFYPKTTFVQNLPNC
jgi:hypothetical protein